MDGSKGTIHKHFYGHAGRWVESLHFGRPPGAGKLRFVKVTNQRQRCRCKSYRAILPLSAVALEERILAVSNRPRLWRLHFQPPHWLLRRIPPFVRYSRPDQSEMTSAQGAALSTDFS